MHHAVDEAEYAFVDERAQVLKEHPELLAHLRSDPHWQVVAHQDDLLLFKRQP
jgi:hypothetical protein